MSQRQREQQMRDLRTMRNTARAMMSQGQLGAVERFGTMLAVGDMVMVDLDKDPVMKVVDIKQDLHPQAQPDAIILTLYMEIPITIRANRPISNIVLIQGAPPAEDKPADPASGSDASNETKKQEVDTPTEDPGLPDGPPAPSGLVLTDL